tara:strand:- start:2245 stop:2598 length:354 start_codon:yes stop_codon:yes gene_type:complete
MDKKIKRHRRARKSRSKIKLLGLHRLCVHRTPRHIYAQIIASERGDVVVSASTLSKELGVGIQSAGNVAAAVAVGQLIAKRAKEKGVERVAFDRSGFKFHGRIKALADAAREGGLSF